MPLDANDILLAAGTDGLRVAFDETFGAKDKANGAGRIGRLKLINAAALGEQVFPPIAYIVPGFLAEGVTLFAGRGKTGKSYLALDLALGIAAGGSVLGGIAVEAGDVLYLALEDNARRLQRRQRQLWGDGKLPTRLSFATECPALDKGGTEAIGEWARSVPRPRLVVVDVLEKVRPRRTQAEGLYEADYRAVAFLKTIADEFGCAILAIHHTSKRPDPADPFDAVSGTTGLTGAVDTVIVLTNTNDGPQLYGRGRDIEEFDKAARFDRTTGRWALLGDAAEVHRSEGLRAILDALMTAAELLSPKQIAAIVEKDENSVSVLLQKMLKAGDVVREGYGRYRHANCCCPRETGQGYWLGVVHGGARVKPNASRFRAPRGWRA